MRDLDKPLKIAVMISGTGSNLVAIAEAIQRGELNAEIVSVVASNPKAKGIMKAQAMGLPVIVFTPANYREDPILVEKKLSESFRNAEVEYIILAGYMRKVTPQLLFDFPNRVINLHPALLPKHPGAHAIQEAFEAGERETGITIHVCNAEYDQGPIIYQRTVPVLEGDTLETLEARIHEAEHEAYPYVIQKLAEEKVRLHGTQARIVD